jgi:molybdopterin/thiamine biosynthesis adenylyltransferase
MLVNLLARSDGVVDRVVLCCPTDIPLGGRIVPLAPRELDLASALRTGADEIGAVPVDVVPAGTFDAPFRFVVGPGDAESHGWRVHGEGWWGGFSLGAIPGNGLSRLAFGPYAAACLAMSELFKAVRAVNYSPTPAAFYSLLSFTASSEPPITQSGRGDGLAIGVHLSCALAGVGAVGSAWAHTIWATPGATGSALLADADDYGVDLTNLNRCPLFGQSSIGKRKASEAARLAADAEIVWSPFDGRIGDAPDRPPLVLSAVDTNAARQEVQALYPARLLSASTLDLRAELLRCDPTTGTACLCCFNPVPPSTVDDELRRRFVAMSEARQQQIAAELGIAIEEAYAWAVEGQCGYAGDRIAQHLRPTDQGPRAFAVGFVSVMAGTMLAAQTVKEVLDAGPVRGTACRAVLQFWNPLAPRNAVGRYLRERNCAACDPDTPACEIWRRRFDSFSMQ